MKCFRKINGINWLKDEKAMRLYANNSIVIENSSYKLPSHWNEVKVIVLNANTK